MSKATTTAKVPAATAKAAPVVKHNTRSAGTVAAQIANGTLKGLAVQTTGAVGGRKQKLVYQYGTGGCKLVAGAAKGSAQRVYLQQLQANKGANTFGAHLAALQAAGHPNPKRVLRRAQRAGILVPK